MVLTAVAILVLLVILSILILVHEFGHFVVARRSGVGVEEFALGLPFTRPVWQKKLKDGLIISLYPVLFGGFVKLLGEDDTAPKDKKIKGKFFFEVNVWKRIAVVVAGAAMNILLAFTAFYLFLSISNFKVLIPKLADYNFLSPHEKAAAVIVIDVGKNSPADSAGLKTGDVILSADGKTFSKVSDFQNYTRGRGGQTMNLALTDTTLGVKKDLTVVPRANPPEGQGPLGIVIGEGTVLNYSGAYDKLVSGLSYGGDMFVYNFVVIRQLIADSIKTHNIEPVSEGVSGPIGIGSAVGTILSMGGWQAIINLVNLTGLLALSLGFINIFPFPALELL